MKLFGWFRRERGVKQEIIDAQHAQARAIEDKHKTQQQWPEILSMRAVLAHDAEENHFGQRLNEALGAKRRRR